jgi:type VI secretion system protein VasG
MTENPAILLRRLNPYCAVLEGAASLCQTRAHAEIAGALAAETAGAGEGDLTVLARRYEWDMDAPGRICWAGWINSRAQYVTVRAL